MKSTLLFARGAVAATVLFAAAGAQAVPVAAPAYTVTTQASVAMKAASYFSKTPGQTTPVLNSSPGLAVWQVQDNASQINWLAFCIEPNVDMFTSTQTYQADTSFTGFDSKTSVQVLYSLYYDQATKNNNTALSFQLALWELYNDSATGSSFGSGTLQLAEAGNFALVKPVISEASGMLTAVKSYNTTGYTPTYDFTSYSATGSQTVVSARLISAVPEPSTYAMMGLGLAMMGFVGRRRKNG